MDFDELMRLAGRFTDDVKEFLTQDEAMPAFLREAREENLSGRELLEMLRKRRQGNDDVWLSIRATCRGSEVVFDDRLTPGPPDIRHKMRMFAAEVTDDEARRVGMHILLQRAGMVLRDVEGDADVNDGWVGSCTRSEVGKVLALIERFLARSETETPSG